MHTQAIMKSLDSPNQTLSLPQRDTLSQPSVAPTTELAKHNLEITPGEKKRGLFLALVTVLGDLMGSIPAGVLFILSPEEAAGVGATLGAGATWGAIGAINGLTALITIPLTMFAYRVFMAEAKALEAAIKKNEENRKLFRESLFFELLRLRCLLDEPEFARAVSTLNLQNDEIHSNQLLGLVNEVFNNRAFNTNSYNINLNNLALTESKEEKHATRNSRTLPSILTIAELERNERIYSGIKTKITNLLPDFDERLHNCYRSVKPPRNRRARAAMYGVAGGIAIFGGLLGINGTLAGLLLLGGCAALPAVGWGLLGLACLAGAIYCGVLIAKAKHKNFQRKDINRKITHRNKLITEIRTKIRDIDARNHERNPEAHVRKVYEREVKDIVSQAAGPVLAKPCQTQRELTAAAAYRSFLEKQAHAANQKPAPTPSKAITPARRHSFS